MDERPERPERDAPDDFSGFTRAEIVDAVLYNSRTADPQPMDERPERDFSDWTRAELMDFVWYAAPVLKWALNTLENRVDDLPLWRVRWKCRQQARRIEQLKERIDQLESKKEELKQDNAKLRREIDDPEQTDSERLARAVADAYQDGEWWASGADLKRWLAERFPFSESTVERRLEDANLWVRGGKKGFPAPNAIRETVQRCVERCNSSA